MAFIKKLFFLLLFFLPVGLRAQVITTVAGCGSVGYAGDGGPATAAYLLHPRDVVVDKHGNVYFTEIDNEVIRKIDTSGIISTVAGTNVLGFSGDGASALGAQIAAPIGIALDRIGNIYFADYNNGRIRKVDTAGIINTVAGTGVFGYNGDSIAATIAQLGSADGVAVDSLGDIYIADHLNHRIRKVNTSGIITTVAGNGTIGYSGDGGPASLAQVTPVSIFIDKYQNIYFTDTFGYVRKINISGTISLVAGNGSSTYSGDGGAATAAGITGLEGIAIDDTGNIYLPDNLCRIRKINTNGIINRIAGAGTGIFSGDGGDPLLANLNFPTGVAVDGKGRIYIADEANQRVRCIGCQAPSEIRTADACKAGQLIISPNPATSHFELELRSPLTGQVQFRVFDALGRAIRQVTGIANSPLPIDLNAPQGVYYIQAITPTQSFMQKLVVE